MLRASSIRYRGTSNMTHRQLLASWLLIATAIAPTQAAVTDAALDVATAAVMPQVISWRRDFHQNPELSNREVRTSKLVAEQLRQMGIEVQTGIAHTGVVGILRGGKPGPTIALRSRASCARLARPVPSNASTGWPAATRAGCGSCSAAGSSSRIWQAYRVWQSDC